ncbi:hypothetical protein QBC32DRAFT_343953 [Pseudoneurospora amorphoporcata]|uniref:Secreted protein n=1 Tax=Pseudoneurospora amorphoporcata TaxID=241081 RepID=A0AAN6NSY0_9PEZI|nr:hypothetical protein QBC32DRAFT_343953 [Pseudoneurospora amorphoporcata]
MSCFFLFSLPLRVVSTPGQPARHLDTVCSEENEQRALCKSSFQSFIFIQHFFFSFPYARVILLHEMRVIFLLVVVEAGGGS